MKKFVQPISSFHNAAKLSLSLKCSHYFGAGVRIYRIIMSQIIIEILSLRRNLAEFWQRKGPSEGLHSSLRGILPAD